MGDAFKVDLEAYLRRVQIPFDDVFFEYLCVLHQNRHSYDQLVEKLKIFLGDKSFVLAKWLEDAADLSTRVAIKSQIGSVPQRRPSQDSTGKFPVRLLSRAVEEANTSAMAGENLRNRDEIKVERRNSTGSKDMETSPSPASPEQEEGRRALERERGDDRQNLHKKTGKVDFKNRAPPKARSNQGKLGGARTMIQANSKTRKILNAFGIVTDVIEEVEGPDNQDPESELAHVKEEQVGEKEEDGRTWKKERAKDSLQAGAGGVKTTPLVHVQLISRPKPKFQRPLHIVRVPKKRADSSLFHAKVQQPQDGAKKNSLCANWPNCKFGDHCLFFHPPLCVNFPNCTFAKSCYFYHPPIPCRFRELCLNPTCNYFHPLQASIACRFGAACTRSDCHFSHPYQTLPAHQDQSFAKSQNMVLVNDFLPRTKCANGPDCPNPHCTFQHLDKTAVYEEEA